MFSGGVAFSDDIPAIAYPSEDELELALDAGEISYDDFLILRELITSGIDSTNLYLLEQVSEPGLDFFLSDSETADGSTSKNFRRIDGYVRHAYSQYLEDEPDVRYQSSLRCELDRTIRMDLRLKREYSGRERFIYRSFSYTGTGFVRKVALGNYSSRYTLGGAFGYRGKLLDCSRRIDSESLLFPDYGGQNGIMVEAATARWRYNAGVSMNRDSGRYLYTTAVNIRRTFGKLESGISAARTRLGNRTSGNKIRDTKLSVFSAFASGKSSASVEIVGQYQKKLSLGAIITEGRYNVGDVGFRLYGWSYADQFADWSSGSRSGGISRRDYSDEVDFEFYNKRAGQVGGKGQVMLDMTTSVRLELDIQSSRINRDTSDTRLSAAVVKEFTGSLRGRLTYYRRAKIRADNQPTRENKDRFQLDLRYTRQGMVLQQSLGYISGTGDPPWYTILTRLNLKVPGYGTLEVRSNISCGYLSTGQVQNWYGFIRNVFDLAEDLSADIKLGRYYSRSSRPHNRMVAMFSLEYAL